MSKLVDHPEEIEAFREPTEEDPWRVLVSGCLHGLACGVDGTDYGMGEARPKWMFDTRVRCIAFCPEDHGIGTPRTMPDLHGGDGFALLDGKARILDENRKDLTEGMLKGSRAMLDVAQSENVDFAVLTDRSAACGSQVISLGCRFEEPVHHCFGVGVAAAMLLRNGVHVVSTRDFKTLALVGARLDPVHAPADDVVDHQHHPWVLENLPLKDDKSDG